MLSSPEANEKDRGIGRDGLKAGEHAGYWRGVRLWGSGTEEGPQGREAGGGGQD